MKKMIKLTEVKGIERLGWEERNKKRKKEKKKDDFETTYSLTITTLYNVGAQKC
jgi:hypothetical protein